jgi:hypothetical protein
MIEGRAQCSIRAKAQVQIRPLRPDFTRVVTRDVRAVLRRCSCENKKGRKKGAHAFKPADERAMVHCAKCIDQILLVGLDAPAMGILQRPRVHGEN